MIGSMTTEAPALVEAIYVAATGGAPMQPVERIEAVAGEGLAGDRYPTGQGYWSGTLILSWDHAINLHPREQKYSLGGNWQIGSRCARPIGLPVLPVPR